MGGAETGDVGWVLVGVAVGVVVSVVAGRMRWGSVGWGVRG